MTDESNNKPEDLLDQATALLRESANAEQPPAHIVDQTLSALSAEESRRSINQWRFSMFKNRSWAAAAAIVIVSAVATFWVTQRSATVAFGAVVDKVRAVSAVSFKMKGKVQIPGGGLQDVTGKITIVDPSKMREEIEPGNMIMIADFLSGKQMWLNPKDKSATVLDTGKPDNPQIKNANVLDQFKKFDPKQFKPVGEKVIDQKTLAGFRNENSMLTQTVWVDPDTQLPVQMETKMSGGLVLAADMVMSDFDWNPQINEADFSLTPPAGYTTAAMTMDMSNLGESDLIDALRRLADLNDGALTDTLDRNGMMQSVKGLAERLAQGKEKDQEAMKKKAMEQMMPIARGLGFIVQQTDAHYAGKGAKLNEANRPILWYKPKDAQRYHVIDAELKVTEAGADQLPKVESVVVSVMNIPAAK